jgi:CRP/FNR family transcriptional regulator
MKTFDWKELIRRHFLFSNLRQDEKKKLIDKFLGDDISTERHYSAKRIILREGESGDSIYIIKSGSVRAYMKGKDGEEQTELSIMKRGDIFGEIAIFQRTMRSATVEANEDCTLLDVDGQKFLDLLEKYPNTEIKILYKLSERLRNTHDQCIAAKLNRIDEKLDQFEGRFDTEHQLCQAKIDTELKVTKAELDASLKASQAIFDHTKLRTDEVIQSAERSRSRLTQGASVIGGFVTIIIAIFGFIGVNQLMDIKEVSKEAKKNLKNVTEHLKSIEKLNEDAKATHKSINEELVGLQNSINESEKYIADNVLEPGFRDALRKNIEANAIKFYLEIKKLDLDDFQEYVERACISVVDAVTSFTNEKSPDYTHLLEFIREDARTEKDKFLSYYALLADAILADKDKFNSEFPKFEHFASNYRGKPISEKEDYILSKFSEFFSEQNEEMQDYEEMQDSHNRIKNLVLNPNQEN